MVSITGLVIGLLSSKFNKLVTYEGEGEGEGVNGGEGEGEGRTRQHV